MGSERKTVAELDGDLKEVRQRVNEIGERTAKIPELEELASRAEAAHHRLVERVDKIEHVELDPEPEHLDPCLVADRLEQVLADVVDPERIVVRPALLATAISEAIPLLRYLDSKLAAAEAVFAVRFPTVEDRAKARIAPRVRTATATFTVEDPEALHGVLGDG